MQMPAMLKGWRKTVSEEGDINWKNGSVTLFKQMMHSIVLDNDSIILILWCYLILRFNFLCFFEYFNTTELLFRTVIRLQLYPLNDDHGCLVNKNVSAQMQIFFNWPRWSTLTNTVCLLPSDSMRGPRSRTKNFLFWSKILNSDRAWKWIYIPWLLKRIWEQVL